MKKLILFLMLLPLTASAQYIEETPLAATSSGLGNTTKYTGNVDSMWTYGVLANHHVGSDDIWSARKVSSDGFSTTDHYGQRPASVLWPYKVAGAFSGATVSGGASVALPAIPGTVTNAASDTILWPSGGVAAYTITYNGGAGAYAIGAPVTGTDDFKILYVTSVAAQAHVVTCRADGFNAKGSSGTVTFSAAIGNMTTLFAYHGHIYVWPSINATVN